jgi:HTH-type transcriptional regulator, competence development regulator
MVDHGQTFGSRLRVARKRAGLTQRQLAEKVGIDFTYLSKFENDQPGQSPGEGIIRKLAEHLNEDPEELLALAGKVPVDDLRDRAGKDVAFARFLRTLPGLSEDELKKVMRNAAKGARRDG